MKQQNSFSVRQIITPSQGLPWRPEVPLLLLQIFTENTIFKVIKRCKWRANIVLIYPNFDANTQTCKISQMWILALCNTLFSFKTEFLLELSSVQTANPEAGSISVEIVRHTLTWGNVHVFGGADEVFWGCQRNAKSFSFSHGSESSMLRVCQPGCIWC